MRKPTPMEVTAEMRAFDKQIQAEAKALQANIKRLAKVEADYKAVSDLVASQDFQDKYYPGNSTRIKAEAERNIICDDYIRCRDSGSKLEQLKERNPRAFGLPWCYQRVAEHNDRVQTEIHRHQNEIDVLRAKLVEPYPPIY